MMAAVLLRIPTVAYEPNAVPGLANRLVGKHVSAAAVNFARREVLSQCSRDGSSSAGSDLRRAEPCVERGASAADYGRQQRREDLQRNMPGIAARLLERVPGLTIVHQTGEKALAATLEAYLHAGVDPARVQVRAFLTDMPEQYAAADLVLARAGSTVAELAAAGSPRCWCRCRRRRTIISAGTRNWW